MKTIFDEAEILARFDKHPDFEFSSLQDINHAWNGKTKFKVFLSDSEWLIVFENYGFSTRDFNFIIDTAFFTSSADYQYILTSNIIDHLPEHTFFKETFDDEGFSLDYFDFELMIRGQKEHFKLNQDDYAKAGISLEDSQIPKYVKILRVLAYLVPEKIFDSDEKLLEKLSMEASVFTYKNEELTARSTRNRLKENTEFKLFLEINDWQHIRRTWDVEELPSEFITFQSLAKAIANRDASLYHCPEELFNTHWSHLDKITFEDDNQNYLL